MLQTSTPDQWEPNADFAPVYEEWATLSRMFYIGANKEIYEYFSQDGVNWTWQRDEFPGGQTADNPSGGIAAVGWQNQTCLYYVSGGRLIENAWNGTNWNLGYQW